MTTEAANENGSVTYLEYDGFNTCGTCGCATFRVLTREELNFLVCARCHMNYTNEFWGKQ